jgi:hypothetical protein
VATGCNIAIEPDQVVRTAEGKGFNWQDPSGGSMQQAPLKDEEEVLTLETANALQWRDLDVSALEAEVTAVWETIHSMQEAQTVSNETLTREISV